MPLRAELLRQLLEWSLVHARSHIYVLKDWVHYQELMDVNVEIGLGTNSTLFILLFSHSSFGDWVFLQ